MAQGFIVSPLLIASIILKFKCSIKQKCNDMLVVKSTGWIMMPTSASCTTLGQLLNTQGVSFPAYKQG